ncbi:MAG TPA: glycosyltransferase, partial [Polyangia bacterium]|nr:glycosyltransferase [Polyangia bacterium]
MTARPLRIAFLHPELGLGGAERLVVDAALELQARGHAVTIFTATHDRDRAFPETTDGSLQVRVHGARLPTRVAGRLQIACTIARVAWAAGALALAGDAFDVVVADLIPYGLPLLRGLRAAGLGSSTKLVYYCHYPDQLLAPPRAGLYRLYRKPFDALEVPAMRAADRVICNSHFTARALAGLGGGDAAVVYPGVDIQKHAAVPELRGDETTVLVLGRFDRRKNVPLALDAVARLRATAPAAFARVRLVVAGGLDPRQPEDAAVAAALTEQARRLGIADKVTLRASPSERERLDLLASSLCVLHAAIDEHFGLVPVEAMSAARPVVAVANAGPLETIVDGTTGFLRQPNPDAFAGA